MIPFKTGTFDGARDYLLSGTTLNELYRALRQRTPVAGAGISLKDVDGGYIIHAASSGETSTAPFFYTYPGTGGTFIQGGQVLAQNSITVADHLLLRTNGDPCEAGDILWLQVTGTALTTNGALTGGVQLSSATLYVGNPSSNYPTATAPSFVLCLEIGRWTVVGFAPGMRGNRQINFYPGPGFRVSLF